MNFLIFGKSRHSPQTGAGRAQNVYDRHGVLHLLGYDHMEEADKALMREKEEAVMARMNLTR